MDRWWWQSDGNTRAWKSTASRAASRSFHASMPGYAPTPLVELPALATELAVRRVLVKDESSRLGLPAFKVLGVSWAVFRVLIDRADEAIDPPSFTRLPGIAARLVPLELVTATDGNHGRALANIATSIGLRSHVVVPDDIEPAAIIAIETEGATVERVTGSYETAVARARDHADAAPDRLLIQDTAWPGYEEIPGWIVEGYSTLFDEIDDQVGDSETVSLIVVPAGVGSLLQAAISSFRDGRRQPPSILSVEPEAAACVLASQAAGRLTTIGTSHTVMAGLNCGVPSTLAWQVIASGLDAAVAVSDAAALAAMRDLRMASVDAGPCGAAALAGVRMVAGDASRRAHLDLGPDATVVLICTDGHASGAG